MDVNDVRGLPWVPVKDWDGLMRTDINPNTGKKRVMKADIESFVEGIFKEIGRKLYMIPYRKLRKVLIKENKSFFSSMNNMYKEFRTYDLDHEILKDLQKALRIPDVDAVPRDRIEECINRYNKLTPEEKLVFFKRIGAKIMTNSWRSSSR